MSYIQDNEVLLTGIFRYTDTWPLATHLVSSGQVDVDSLVTGRYGLTTPPRRSTPTPTRRA